MKTTLLFLIVLLFAQGLAGKINRKHLPTDQEILSALDTNIPALEKIIRMRDAGESESALMELAEYFKQKSANRYYFNWMNFESRFDTYKSNYAAEFKKHKKQADYQMSTYGGETTWMLPAVDLKGREVTAYELRHLTRQQKSADMTLMYYYEKKNPEYLDYFVRQVADLNRAFAEGKYDDGGNAVYEVFRAGKRIHNWLFNYNAYLASSAFTSTAQINLIRTFLHHGAQIYNRSKRFRYGNHQTKGLVALFEISTMFPEFTDSDKWRQRAVDGLVWHIKNEINADGFQFERSVHYHMGDITNYFRVYQLAQINQLELPAIFTTQFKKMFTALISIAQPNKRLPVLQDDTDAPYTENNDVSGVMTIGTLLFEEPNFRYFAGNEIPAFIYWLLSEEQLRTLDKVLPEAPQIGSAALESTGYYTMRGGWENDDLCMTISSGLSEHKPDHQHGDMLGVVAYANGHEILPNYQVRYKHPEYQFFKNSWVKNVALADNFVQGRGWKQNRGKSGFGKWKKLPKTNVLSWITGDTYDYFDGRHNGFDSLNIAYNREVLFIKNEFWLIRDVFEATSPHTFQQVWQGAYKESRPGEIIKTYGDGSGLLIRQLSNDSFRTKSGSRRNKHYTFFEAKAKESIAFSTLLVPFSNKSALNKNNEGWQINILSEYPFKSDAELSLASGNQVFLFKLNKLSLDETDYEFQVPATVFITRQDNKIYLRYIGSNEIEMLMNRPGQNPKHIRLNPDSKIEL